jgi:hypothetical protein
MYPDAETPAAREEVVQVLRGVRNNFPGLLEEMQPSREQDAIATAQSVLPNVAGTLNISDRVHALMARFAARVGLALHFELCGETLPVSGGVFIKWYTNSAIVDREIDQSFLAALGDPKTLRQGRQSLEDQFEYSSLATETGHMSTHFVAFRASFAVQAFAARDIADLAPAVETPHRVFRPGFLKIPYQSIDPG